MSLHMAVISGPVLTVKSGSICCVQSQIIAKYSGKDLKIQFAPNQVYRESNATLTNSTAIAFMLASPDLRGGSSVLHQAQVLQWINYADSELCPIVCNLVHSVLGIPFDIPCFNTVKVVEEARTSLNHHLSILNTTLLHLTFLVGERISLADIALFNILLPLYQQVLNPSSQEHYINLNRWFNTILLQPEVQDVIGTSNVWKESAVISTKKTNKKNSNK